MPRRRALDRGVSPDDLDPAVSDLPELRDVRREHGASFLTHRLRDHLRRLVGDAGRKTRDAVEAASQLALALTEALSNAILRGNREDRHKVVRVRARVDDIALVVEVADEGTGFDLEACTLDPTVAERLEAEDGRGLFLMRRLAHSVEQFVDGGNVVRLTVRRA